VAVRQYERSSGSRGVGASERDREGVGTCLNSTILGGR